MPEIHIITFGYGHAPPPEADITLDLRRAFRDPHVDPTLRHKTAHDEAVRLAVLNTPGIFALIDAATDLAETFTLGPGSGPVTVAIGCAGGRHRAATVGIALATTLMDADHTVELTHRDLDKPVIERNTPEEHAMSKQQRIKELEEKIARAEANFGPGGSGNYTPAMARHDASLYRQQLKEERNQD